MGTGSAGGGGSGGGRGGSGSGEGSSGGGLGGGGRIFFDPARDAPTSTLAKATELAAGGGSKSKQARRDEEFEAALRGKVRKQVAGVLRAPARRAYLRRQLCNIAMRRAYETALAIGKDPCHLPGIDVADGPRYLLRVVEELAAQWEEVEPDPRMRDTARSTLEDFLMLALQDPYKVYMEDDCESVQRALRPEIVRSTAGHFLGRLLWSLLEREVERLPEREMGMRLEEAQGIADELLARFEERFVGSRTSQEERSTVYARLLTTLCTEAGDDSEVSMLDWFMMEFAQ